MNSSAPIDSDQATVLDSVGLTLRRAREEQSKTRDDACQEINLRMDQLTALEGDQFELLPGDTFVRGYLRTYARWLKLDVDQVLAAYIGQTGAGERVSLSADLNVRGPISRNGDHRRIIGAAIVIGLFFLGFWFYNNSLDLIAEPTVAANEIAVDTFSGEPLDSVGTDSLENSTSGQPQSAADRQSEWQNPFTSNAETPVTPSPSSGEPVVAEAPAALQVSTPSETQLSGDQSVVTDSNNLTNSSAGSASSSVPFSSGITRRGSGPDELLFHFKEDCWLEVKNNDGRKLFSASRKAGQSLLLKGAAPFYVVVGNAPAVQLTFNGDAVTVRSNNRRNLARLTLGGNR
ncbi:MAG: RodZ domain-containing protein [Pseudomonadales bacterium]